MGRALRRGEPHENHLGGEYAAGGSMLTIAKMQLSPNARRGAEWIRDRWPKLVFTSGRRDALDQARVMAHNTVKYGRNWIVSTYKPSPIVDTLNGFLLDRPELVDTQSIAHGFYECLLACHSGQLTSLSRHLTGGAWDAAWPGDAEGEKIVKDIQIHMPVEYGLDKVIDREGGLRLIHAQFKPSVEI